jgi:hypothetical protein
MSVGDAQINALTVGGWDISRINFLSAQIMETIFTPGVMAEIEVVDSTDSISGYNLSGGESVNLNFSKPNGATANYDLTLNSVREIESHGALHAKTYKLVCVGTEVLTGAATTVQQAFNTQISSMVQSIFEKIGSGIAVEQTIGNRNMNITNQTVFEAIEMLRKEAVSQQNQSSSNYMFFQNAGGYNFQTIEGMTRSGDVKTFTQINTVGHDFFSNLDDNILSWEVLQSMDAMNRVSAGTIAQRVLTFNTHTHEFKQQDFTPAGVTELASTVITTLSSFTSLFSGANRPIFRYVNPNITNQNVPKSFMPDTIPNKMTNKAQMMEQLMRMSCIGDPVLMAGKTVFCDIPQVIAVVNPGREQQMYGRWLISKLTHDIRRPDVQPRYLCNLECIKGGYQQG